MKVLIFFLIGIVTISCLTLIGNSCGTMIHRTEIKKDYNFPTKQEIGVYIVPSEVQDLNNIFSNVLQMYFLSRGYKVNDINRLMSENSDSIVGSNPNKIIESLKQREYIKTNNIYVIGNLKWDSVFVAIELEERINRIYKGFNVTKLTTDLVMYDPELKKPIFSFSDIDTAKLYTVLKKNYEVIKDPSWILAGRQLLKNLDGIPECSDTQDFEKLNKLKVSFWVDKSYRDAFPKVWRERINKIVNLANDILRSQFNFELEIYTINKWDTEFENSLKQTFNKLEQREVSFSNVIRVAVTFDQSLANDVNDRSFLGLAKSMGTVLAITAQPSFPGMGYWNPVEEATTLVHEVAHLLGAIHVKDKTSIMYRNSGFLSFRFDEENQCIVKAMSENFLDIDKKQRTQNYIHTLIDLNQNRFENRLPILSYVSNNIYDDDYKRYSDSIQLDTLYQKIMSLTQDSVYALAIMGVTELQHQHWEKAIELLSKVIMIKPNFAEAHWYLSKAYQKTGDLTESHKHKEVAEPFLKNWVFE